MRGKTVGCTIPLFLSHYEKLSLDGATIAVAGKRADLCLGNLSYSISMQIMDFPEEEEL